ncbi:MAG: glucuronate isomerase [Candidatus Ratteibacteria bacterium]|nr:glucuronate isomerase [Candidatus Ratteibacteria bacterium]
MNIAKRIYEQIHKIPIVDIHTHVDFKGPFAKNAWQILSYHYFTEMAHSQGMPGAIIESERPSDKEKTEKLSKYFTCMQTTQPYSWLMDLSQKLFDFPHEQINSKNWAVFYKQVGEKSKNPERLEEICKLSNIEMISTTNLPWENLDGIEKYKNKKSKQLFVPTFRVDSLLTADRNTIKNLEKSVGSGICVLKDYENAIIKRVSYFMKKGAKSFAVSLDSNPMTMYVGKREAEENFNAIVKNKPSNTLKFKAHMLDFLSSLCEKNKLLFQLMVGVERDVYEKGIPGGKDIFQPNGTLLGLKYILNKYSKVNYPISVLSSNEDKELAVYARIFPNVYASGHWWFENTYESVKINLKNRLSLTPYTKMIGQYSDAYTAELIGAKIDMYKHALSDILEEYVNEKIISTQTALDIAKSLLYNSPKKLLGI